MLLGVCDILTMRSTVRGRAVTKFGVMLQTGRKVTVPRHTGDMAEGTLRAILREAQIDVDDFLGAR